MSVNAAAARVREKLNARVQAAADRTMQTAATIHMNAPRGGVNINRYGQRRSAPGEQPAIETGQLLDRIVNGVERSELRARVTVNYAKLEWGYDAELGRVEPRPMGRMTLAEMLTGGQW